MTCPSVLPQDNGQTDDCGSGEKTRAATTILSQSHPAVAHGCSCTSLLGVPQQTWPVATMLAALPCFQMLAHIKRSLKFTFLWRRDIWKVNCCCSCRDQHGAERSPSDPLWALTHIWKAWDLLPCELLQPSWQGKHLLQAGLCSSSHASVFLTIFTLTRLSGLGFH